MEDRGRLFAVIVTIPGAKALTYPPKSAGKALANMVILSTRGHAPIARTTANGVTEDLSLDEMHEIYSDWLA